MTKEETVVHLRGLFENFKYQNFAGTYPEVVMHGLTDVTTYLNDLVKRQGQPETDFQAISNNIAAKTVIQAADVTINSFAVGLAVSIPGIGTIAGAVVAALNKLIGISSIVGSIERRNASQSWADELGKFIDASFKNANPFNLTDQQRSFLYSSGLQLLHERPKCQGFSSDCASEHGWWIERVSMYRQLVDAYRNTYHSITVENLADFQNSPALNTGAGCLGIILITLTGVIYALSSI